MNKNTQNKFVFLVFVLLAAGVYVWFFPMNKGVLELKTGIEGYQVFLDGKPLPCTADPCTTQLKVGEHELLLQKEKHATVRQMILIRRGQVNTVEMDLKRVYTLDPSKVVPKIELKTVRPLPKGLKALAWTWNKEETALIYLDTKDERLKLWKEDGTMQVITVLKNLDPLPALLWSPNETQLVAHQNQDLYWIDVKKASRHKRRLDFMPKVFQWSPTGEVLLVTDKDKMLYKLSAVADNILSAGLQLDLAQAAWISDTTLLFFDTDPEKRRTDIKTYDPIADRLVTLTVKFEFVATHLQFDSANNTAYLQKDSGEWYTIRF